MTALIEARLLFQIKALLADWPVAQPQPQNRSEPVNPTKTAAVARTIYRGRRARDAIFGSDADLFGEPAWDILLDLYIAHQMSAQVSISSACIAAGVPGTTALRHLKELERRGFIERTDDPDDRRRSFVLLSERAIERMNLWLDGVGGTHLRKE